MAEVLELERMTSTELREAVDAGSTTVIVPVGAIEQHSGHLPLGTDAILGDEIGRLVAKRLGAVLAPTVRVGCSKHHMHFAGTLTLREETLEAMLIDVAESLAEHGFRRVVLLPTH